VDILTIDFETYYAKDYSLSKMTTEEYIRDPRFEVIGVVVKVNDGAFYRLSGNWHDIDEFLHVFDWDNSVAVAHNAMFDMAILNWHFNIRPKRIVDTLSMARALVGSVTGVSLASLSNYFNIGTKGNEVVFALGKHRRDFHEGELIRYLDYCQKDVELTYRLFRVLVDGFPLNELRLIDLTIRMFTEPVLELDVNVLNRHLADVQYLKALLMLDVTVQREDLMSNPKLANTLLKYGVEPPMKISPATGKDTYAFGKNDEGFKALLEHEDIVIQALVAARLGVKSTLEETRTERLIGVSARGKMPIPLRYYAAHTGRWGGDDKVNMQNIPRSSALKYAIVAPEGYVMIDSDSSQIEARTLAWLAGQNDLVDAFDRGEDVYKIMASAIYGKPESEITDGERFVGKTTILGCGYGMGAAKFRMQLKTFNVDLSEKECERIIKVYRETYPAIPKLWRSAGRVLAVIADINVKEDDKDIILGREGVLAVEGQAGIRLPNGLYLRYPNLRSVIDKESGQDQFIYDTVRGRSVSFSRIYGGKCVENICQALARIIIGEQMIMVAKKYKVVMTVHDAIACVVPEEDAAVALEDIKTLMRVRPSWALELPLNCEAGFGKSYGNC